MHEASIAQNVFDSVRARVESGEITGRLRIIHLRVGQLTAVIPEHLHFMWEMVVKDSPFEGVKLDIEEVSVRVRCRDCGHETDLDRVNFFCSSCDSSDLEILGGRELLIDAVEVE
jgi:hydrogenase nickel incorporation protein HypA/HybF